MREERTAPKKFQIRLLRRHFRKLNPDKDPEMVDWHGYVTEGLSYNENLKALMEAYPWFNWVEEPRKFAEDEKLHYEVEGLKAAIRQVSPELAEEAEALLSELEGSASDVEELKKEVAQLRKQLKSKIPAKAIPPEIERPPKVVKPEIVWFHADVNLEFVGVDGVEYRVLSSSLVRIPKIDADRFERQDKGEASLLSYEDRDEILESAFAFLRRAGVLLPEEFGDRLKASMDYKENKVYNMKRVLQEAAKIYDEMVTLYGMPGARRFPRKLMREEKMALEDYFGGEVTAAGGYITDEVRGALEDFFELEFTSVGDARKKIREFKDLILKGVVPKIIVVARIPPKWATTRGKVIHLGEIGYSVEAIAEETLLSLDEVEKILREAGLPLRRRA